MNAVETPADAELSEKPGSFSEVGTTGTVFFQGIISGDEYNPTLQGDAGLQIYDRMWRSDGQVAALIRILELPLLQAQWSVKAASDDPLDVEVGQFVQDNLMHGMTRTWTEVLEHILTMYRYGFSVQEKVWTLGTDARVRLKKLAPRLALTCYRFFPTQDGELDHIQQRTFVLNEDGTGGTFKFIDIPADRLLVFSLKKEGSNFRGISILRHAYKHWFYKEGLYKVDAIACERNGLGIPTVNEPANVQESDRNLAAKALAALHAHQKAYMQMPFGWTFKMEGISGTVRDIHPSISHHDLMIARSVLAQFINLESGGSYALAKDLSTFFLQSLKAIANMICERFNREIIRELVDYNYNVERYPTLEVSRIDTRDIDDFLRGLSSLFTAQALTNNAETENALRELLDLPDLPPGAEPEAGGAPTVDVDSQGTAADSAIASGGNLDGN